MLRSREFTARDAPGTPPVVIVNEAAAARYWPGQDPVGRRTSRGEVVGVVANSRHKGLTADVRPAMYLPILQRYVPEQTIHVRTATDAGAMAGTLVREIGALNPALPLYNVRTLAERRDGSLYAERLSATLLTLFGFSRCCFPPSASTAC